MTEDYKRTREQVEAFKRLVEKMSHAKDFISAKRIREHREEIAKMEAALAEEEAKNRPTDKA